MTTRRALIFGAVSAVAAPPALAQSDPRPRSYSKIGDPAPPFALPKYRGGTAQLSDYGGRVLMLLFVTYQLWWTNVRAHAQAGSEAHQLQDDWANGARNPGVFEPGQGFAILHIPKLDVAAPIAEGVSNKKVLDKGMVGHYGEAPLKTAMPDAKTQLRPRRPSQHAR